MEFLICSFSIELYQQIELGLTRNYLLKEENQNFIHGKWDITSQIKKHAYEKHRFDLLYDDFTDNIIINRLKKIS